MPFPDGTFDCALAILSAHEIRNTEERSALFRELRRIIKPDGVIFVTEHIRDVNNFLAYTIGAFHFHSRPEWLRTFENAGLAVIKETKTTPFITTFMLKEK
jgi:ubiquinone/menaquinone biosynthesis C-methylase UbiE